MTYEIRSFDSNGQQSEIIPGAKISVTDELFTNGMVRIDIPRASFGASRLSKRLEVALFLDGKEIANTRAILTDHTGNPADGGDAAGVGDTVTYAGKTLYARLGGAVTYPQNWPKTVVPPYHDFNNATPGTILKTLFTRAQQRGAIPWLDHSSWTSVLDASGASWTKTASLRYDTGTLYTSVVDNLVRLGACEFRMQGRRFDLFNPDGVGVDLTVGPNPVVLRRGRDVIDTPYSESTDDLYNTVLVTGGANGTDGPTIFERSDASSVSAFGRIESSINQGQTYDVGTLAILADTSLDGASSERGEYSTKFTPDSTGPRPHVDFQSGDWVYFDKQGTLERYRVRQLSVTTDDNSYQVVCTLNDKFTEFDLRTAKKVQGILGGAGADTISPANPDTTDYTIPSPPTGLGVITALYTDPATGLRRGMATSNWLPPQTNTDGTACDDLAGYEIEIQTDGQVVYDSPPTITNMQPSTDLARRWDRRGVTTPGWIGADGGGNWQDDGGNVWHAWGDTLFGILQGDGTRKDVTMARNTMTTFVPSQLNDLTSFGGVQNLLPNGCTMTNTTNGWLAKNCALQAVTSWAGGTGGNSVQMTSSASGVVNASVSLTRTTSQNNVFKPVTAGATYRLMCEFDTLPVGSASVVVEWLKDDGSTITTSSVPTSGTVVDGLMVAPTGAVTGNFYVQWTATASGQVVRFTRPGIFETPHQMGAWRPNAQSVTVTNLVTNPDGGAVTGSTPTGWTGLAGSTLTQDTSTVRYNGTSVKVARGSASGNLEAGAAVAVNGRVTGAAWVYSATATTARLDFRAGSTVVLTGYTVQVPASTWTMIRAEGTTSAAASSVVAVFGGGDTFDVAEMTVVAGPWDGGTFTGSSTNQQGITCAWTGAKDASTSTAAFQNTNWTEPGYNFFGTITPSNHVMQLFDTSGLPEGHIGEWAWAADGTYTTGDKAIVVYSSVMCDASIKSGWNFGFTGSYWIAEYDLAKRKLIRARRLARDPRGGAQAINWGGATLTTSGYTYIFGQRTTAGSAANYVLRAPVGQAYDGPYQVWTGSGGWTSIPSGTDIGRMEMSGIAPANVGSTPGAGFSSVREFKGAFKAFAPSSGQPGLVLWTAPAPQGPWSVESTVWQYPNSTTMYYSAKFETASDSNQLGYAALICQSSNDNPANPGLYIPQWLRSQPGQITAGAGGTTWTQRQSVDNPPAPYSDLNPGTVVSTRVRAVDSSGNLSEWVVSQPVIITRDTQGPNKPSKPFVKAQFQGVRVQWNGLDTNGATMPADFAFYEVHISTDEDFKTTPDTMVDKLATAGGASSIFDLVYGTTYWVRIVAVDTEGNRSEDSDAASAQPQRLSDPDLPDKLITGAKIADGAINTQKLTVAAFGENLIAGGNMEEARDDGSGVVFGWKGYFSADPQQDVGANAIAGTASLRMDVTDKTVTVETDQAIPITPGEVYYVSLKVRASRLLDAPHVGASLALADTADKAGAGFGQDTPCDVGSIMADVTTGTIEKGVETPWNDDLKFGRLVIRCQPEATPYTVWIDDVEVRKITGEAAIADASINTAKIKNLAVDDSKIANLSVGKVTAGTITADWINSGRIRTPVATNGAWTLIDGWGVHSYKDADGVNKFFDITNGNLWMSGVVEGSEIRGGVAYFPSQYASVPGRTTINDQGLAVDAQGTVNLCPNPSFELGASWAPSTDTQAALSGAAVTDSAGNVDLVSVFGTSALKIWNTKSPGYVDIPLGKANPSTTYTVSWFSAPTNIDDTSTGFTGVSVDFGTVGVMITSNHTRIATGRSGYIEREGPLQGVWTTARSSGVATMADAGGWYVRSYLTFTTPSSLSAGAQLDLRLPTPVTSSGAAHTTQAICYDAIQLEQQPWMTRYCDGDRPGCSWDGTRNNSTSRRPLIRSFWAPTQDEPSFQGDVRGPLVAANRMKLGSGTQHGSNFVETLMKNNWECWKGGSGWWAQINWDNSFDTSTEAQGRIASDDGDIFPSTGGMVFTTTLGGFYIASATITFPQATQNGFVGLRLRHLFPGQQPKGTLDDSGVIATSKQKVETDPHGTGDVVTVTWMGWSWPGWGMYWEAFQTTQDGTATMPGNGRSTPCRASLYQLL